MRKTIILLSISVLLINASFAANANVGGNVTNKNAVSISSVATNLNLDTDVNEVKIFDYSITNNDKDGFKVSFTSANDGQLRLVGEYDPLNEGTYIDYLISIQKGIGGSLGTDEVALPTDTQLSSTAPLDLVYNSGVKKKTKDAIYNVLASISNINDAELLGGAYEDTVTIIVSNL